MALFLSLPWDFISEYVCVRMGAALRVLDKPSATTFEKAFVPRFLVSLTRPSRLSGRLMLSQSYTATFSETPMSSDTLLLPVDVPIDMAAAQGSGLTDKLFAKTLPGQRKMWRKEGASVAGFLLKTSPASQRVTKA
jgi:hypothetical protein